MRADILNLPLVSIVVPCYNHELYVAETINSIINQDYENIELLVIDDGSSDASVARIETMIAVCHLRFKRFEFRVRSNVGLSATLNEGIKWCKGDYYSAIASDDLMLPCKTSIQVKYMELTPNCVAVFGGVEVLNEKGELLRVVTPKFASHGFEDLILMRYKIFAPTQMIRLDAIQGVNGYRENFVIEDWYMWLMLSSAYGSLDCIESILAKYRRHEGNLSKQLALMILGRDQILDLFVAHPLYKRAKANALIMAAIDMQLINRKKSFFLLCSSLRWNVREFFQRRVGKYVLKMLLPRSYLARRIEG